MLNVDEFDGVVVGAGAAGLIAALRAATLGAHIALIEAEDGSTSNLAVSGGLFPGAGTRFQAPFGIADSPNCGRPTSAARRAARSMRWCCVP